MSNLPNVIGIGSIKILNTGSYFAHFLVNFLAIKLIATCNIRHLNIKCLDVIHCKCLQGFTGTLQGNESAGISNLQGLQVTCNACKKISGKPLKSAGDMFYKDTVGKTQHHL